jgi:hypothetical protein
MACVTYVCEGKAYGIAQGLDQQVRAAYWLETSRLTWIIVVL